MGRERARRRNAGDAARAFRVGRTARVSRSVLVKRKRARPASSWFDVYLEHDESLRKPEHHFIRSLITIPDVRVSGDKATRALIVIEEPALSRFLGDAENPAHSDWSERADKIRTLYDSRRVDAALRQEQRVVSGVAARASARRPRARLSRPISSPSTCPASRVARRTSAVRISDCGRRRGRHRAPKGRRRTPVPHAVAVTISRIAGGFTIRGAMPCIGRPLRGEVAYRVRAGNAFRKHSPFDFDLTSRQRHRHPGGGRAAAAPRPSTPSSSSRPRRSFRSR
jgi:hypothetical protein